MLPLAVLAGGFATRLGELGRNSPKCLIKVNGRPFVDWQLDLLTKNGYSDFVFCVSYKSDAIQKYLGDGSNRGVNIEYSFDGEIQLPHIAPQTQTAAVVAAERLKPERKCGSRWNGSKGRWGT